MNKPNCRLLFIILLIVIFAAPLFSQEANEEIISEPVTDEDINSESIEESEIVESEKGQFHFFLNSSLIFAMSLNDGGFGLGETATVLYTLPFHLSFGIESGYYGFRGEAENNGFTAIGGFSIIPIYGLVSYDIKLFDGIFLTPVLKGGIGYTDARINGWIGGEGLSGMFEGGVRMKAVVADGLIIQGNITYTGLIEKSGLFSILSLGFGFGI